MYLPSAAVQFADGRKVFLDLREKAPLAGDVELLVYGAQGGLDRRRDTGLALGY
jgi:hypothetical protein